MRTRKVWIYARVSEPFQRGIRDVLVHVRRKDFDVLLIYDWTRLAIHRDLYMEVKLFCDQHHVTILTMQDIESRFLG